MNFTSVEEYFYQRQKELCVNNIFDISSCESADRALSTMQRRDMTKVGKKGEKVGCRQLRICCGSGSTVQQR